MKLFGLQADIQKWNHCETPRSLQPSVLQECKKALSMLYLGISLYLIEYEDNDDDDDHIQKLLIYQ